MTDRSELKRRAREHRPAMGILAIRNRRNGRFLLRASSNVRAALNRLTVEITPSTDPNLALLEDWRSMGREAFEIGVLDELAPKDEPGWDPAEDLAALAQIWRDRLIAEGGAPY